MKASRAIEAIDCEFVEFYFSGRLIMQSIGTARAEPGDDADPFEREMWAYAEKENVTIQVANAPFNRTKPQEWAEWYRRAKQNQQPVTA